MANIGQTRAPRSLLEEPERLLPQGHTLPVISTHLGHQVAQHDAWQSVPGFRMLQVKADITMALKSFYFHLSPPEYLYLMLQKESV